MFKTTRSRRILAIDPGTRHMGIAVIDSGQLIYHGVESIAKGRSPHQTLKVGRKAVLRFINDFRPDILSIEKTFFANNRNSALLNVFADEIRAVGKRKGLMVHAFAPSAVKKAVCGNGWAKKEDVAKAVAARYAELKVYIGQDRKWKSRYHSNMFDAVAVGIMASGKSRIEKVRSKRVLQLSPMNLSL
jgi:crossover junction endodeoxyribonuclease RuvC